MRNMIGYDLLIWLGGRITHATLQQFIMHSNFIYTAIEQHKLFIQQLEFTMHAFEMHLQAIAFARFVYIVGIRREWIV